MANFKCRYCGGDLRFEIGETVGKCLACKKEQAADDDTAYALGMEQMSYDILTRYEAALRIFQTIPGVKDADEKAAACRAKIEKLKAREEEYKAAELWRAEQEKLAAQAFAAARRRRRIVKWSIIGVCVLLLILALVVFLPWRAQHQIKRFLAAGDYDRAYNLMAVFSDANAILESKYDRAAALIAAEDYTAAYLLLHGMDYKDSKALCDRIRPAYEREVLSGKNAGEYACFGAYEQDDDTDNGKEDIEWLVLDKEGDSVLLVSRYALDCRRFHGESGDVTFAQSDLCVWLNETFLTDAFDAGEAAMLQDTAFESDGAEASVKVFLLSSAAAETYFEKDRDRWCAPTAAAVAHGAWATDEYTVGGRPTVWWWLSSPGSLPESAACVLNSGAVSPEGRGVNNTFLAVRPAIWVNLAEN